MLLRRHKDLRLKEEVKANEPKKAEEKPKKAKPSEK